MSVICKDSCTVIDANLLIDSLAYVVCLEGCVEYIRDRGLCNDYCKRLGRLEQVSHFLHCLDKKIGEGGQLNEIVTNCLNEVLRKFGGVPGRLYKTFEKLLGEISGKVCILPLIALVETLSRILTELLKPALSGLKGDRKIEYICRRKVLHKVQVLCDLIKRHVLEPCRQVIIANHEKPLSYVITTILALLIAEITGQYGLSGKLVRDAMLISEAILGSCDFLTHDKNARKLFEDLRKYMSRYKTLKRFIECCSSVTLGSDHHADKGS